MARHGTKSIVMYTTKEPELQAAFERVHDHMGRTYTQSGILAELVRRKNEEIQAGGTRRDQVAGLREDITALTARMLALEVMFDTLFMELKRGQHDSDHA
jgi:hypothetical protein